MTRITKEYQLGQTIVQALRGVSLELVPGQSYAIVGPSGSGKSSLLHIMGCMDTPTGGEACFNGHRLSGLSPRARTRLRARDIGFVFQAFHLNPILTAQENVAIVLRFLGIASKEANQKAAQQLKHVGLAHRLNHYPAELSGGERQRVAVARAIVKNPTLILADEPTGNLDSRTGEEIIALLREINDNQATTVVIVTHNLELADRCGVTLRLRDGMLV